MQTQDIIADLKILGLPADATTPQVQQRYQQLIAAFTCNTTDPPKLIELSSATRDRLHKAYSRILPTPPEQQVQPLSIPRVLIGVVVGVIILVCLFFLFSYHPSSLPSNTDTSTTIDPQVIRDSDMSRLESKTAGDNSAIVPGLSPRNLVYYYIWSVHNNHMHQASNCWDSEYFKNHVGNIGQEFLAYLMDPNKITCPAISEFNSVTNGGGITVNTDSSGVTTASVDPKVFNIPVTYLNFKFSKKDGQWRLADADQHEDTTPPTTEAPAKPLVIETPPVIQTPPVMPPPVVTDNDMSQLESKTAGDSAKLYPDLSPRNLVYYFLWLLQHGHMTLSSNCWSNAYIKNHLTSTGKEFMAWRPTNPETITCPEISAFNSVTNGGGISVQTDSSGVTTASVDPKTFHIPVTSLSFTLGKEDGRWRLADVKQQVGPTPEQIATMNMLKQLKSDMKLAVFNMNSINGGWASKLQQRNYWSGQMASIRQPPPLNSYGQPIYQQRDPTGYWINKKYDELQQTYNRIDNDCQGLSESYYQALQRYKAALEKYNTYAPQVGWDTIQANYPPPAGQ